MGMSDSMKTRIMAGLTVGMLVLLMAPVHGKSGSSAGDLSMTIVDFPSGFTPDVTNDGIGVYTDHDLTGGDTCVSATLGSNGFTQIGQNYLISTTHGKNVWCNNTQSASFKARYWKMLISDSTACEALLGSSASAPCAVGPVNDTDFERILPGNAFSSNSSPVVFQFTQDGTGYSVQTDRNATIAPGSLTNTRTVTYTGTAKLYHSGTAISGSFSFAFQLFLEKL